MLVGKITFVTTLDWSLSVSGDKLYCEAMVDPGVDGLRRL